MPSARRRLLGALLLHFAIALPASACPERDAAEVRRRFASKPVWVVGEQHRVAANHRLFGALVAGALEAGESVLVGLEIPADRQARLKAGLAGDGGPVASEVIDCPSYRELLARLGALGAAHPGRLRALAIDAPSGATGERDRHMAEVLEGARVKGQRALALVGNLHALKATPDPHGSGPARLAARLEAAGVGVASLLQLGTGRMAPGQGSGVLAATAESAAPPLLALARLISVPGGGAAGRPGLLADAVILRP